MKSQVLTAWAVFGLLAGSLPAYAQTAGSVPEPRIEVRDADPPSQPIATIGSGDEATLQGVVGTAARTPPPPRAPAKPRANVPGHSITVKPNVNQSYAIALFHVNRLITPFKDAATVTSSTAGIAVHDGNIVTVTTDREDPIGLFIYDRSAPTQAISLTLYPAEVAQVSVNINLEGWTQVQQPSYTRSHNPAAAQAWETEAPYIATLKELFKGLALGQVPDGYGLRQLGSQDRGQIPYCAFPGVQIEHLQALDGYSVSAYVARVTNLTYGVVELAEASCTGENLLAVSAWPTNRLSPGEEVELYLVVKTPENGSGFTERPSVIRNRR